MTQTESGIPAQAGSPVTFMTGIWLGGKTATGIQVPAAIVEALGPTKNPRVVVSLNGYTYRGSVQSLGGQFLIALSAEHRLNAGVAAGDMVEVRLDLDTEPRTVELPSDLREALSATPGILEAFGGLSYTLRKEYVRQVESAKTQATRDRRIAGIVGKLGIAT